MNEINNNHETTNGTKPVLPAVLSEDDLLSIGFVLSITANVWCLAKAGIRITKV